MFFRCALRSPSSATAQSTLRLLCGFPAPGSCHSTDQRHASHAHATTGGAVLGLHRVLAPAHTEGKGCPEPLRTSSQGSAIPRALAAKATRSPTSLTGSLCGAGGRGEKRPHAAPPSSTAAHSPPGPHLLRTLLPADRPGAVPSSPSIPGPSVPVPPRPPVSPPAQLTGAPQALSLMCLLSKGLSLLTEGKARRPAAHWCPALRWARSRHHKSWLNQYRGLY